MIYMLLILGLGLLIWKATPAKEAWAGDIRDLIRKVKFTYPFLGDVPEDLIVAISKVESNHDPAALGAAGEIGLMQVKPVTAQWILHKWGFSPVSNLYDPFTNLLTGLLYLNQLAISYGNWDQAIHAYNVGPGNFANGVRNDVYYAKVKMWQVLA